MSDQDYVVKIIAAGKAGLDTLPYMLDEMVLHNVPLLTPHAIDFDERTLTTFDEAVRQPWRRELYLSHGHDISSETCRVKIGSNEQVEDSIRSRKPIFYEMDKRSTTNYYHNRPAALSEWALIHASEIWDEYLAEFKNYRNKGSLNTDKLIIIIPYCPEGPTSGTIGAVLAGALREQIDLSIRADDVPRGTSVKIWGIELCPPMNYTQVMTDGQARRNNAFRGYVARQELFDEKGVEVEMSGQKRRRPFDICLAVDGSLESTDIQASSEQDYLLQLDKAAARIAVALVEGAAGDDLGEAMDTLERYWRWQAYMYDISSEYEDALRAIQYLNEFPVVTQDEADNEVIMTRFQKAARQLSLDWRGKPGVKEAFARQLRPDSPERVTDEMVNTLLGAVDDWYDKQELHKELKAKARANFIVRLFRWISRRSIKLDPALNDLRRSAENAYRAYSVISDAFEDPDYDSDNLLENLTSVPFGNVINLHTKMVREYVRSKEPVPLYKLLRRGRSEAIKDQIAKRVSSLLTRRHWDPQNNRTTEQGKYARILVVPIGSPGNRALLPAKGIFALHANRDESAVEIQQTSEYILDTAKALDHNGFYLNMRILVLAAGATFEDVGSYSHLAQIYHDVISDPDEHLSLVRYHAFDVPHELEAHYKKTFGDHVENGDEPERRDIFSRPHMADAERTPQNGDNPVTDSQGWRTH